MSSLGQFKPQTPIDDTRSDNDSTEPYVAVRPYNPSTVLLEQEVVHKPQEGLEKSQNQQYDAKHGMCSVDHAQVCRHPDSNARSGHISNIRKDLK